MDNDVKKWWIWFNEPLNIPRGASPEEMDLILNDFKKRVEQKWMNMTNKN